MTGDLTDRILTVLAQPKWQEEPPGSGVIAEVLSERRRDVLYALMVLEADGKVDVRCCDAVGREIDDPVPHYNRGRTYIEPLAV